ncbi:MAG: S-layer homology domain-containing protein [Clostridia bacterium]|nr:S-layer homology domain-containing protein [Clostridia bacterium]
MLVSMLPQELIVAQADNIDKGKREVYLHAFDTPPSLDTSEIRTTIEEGDVANIYLAIDNPNKGGINDDGTRKAPQYDLQGYTVKIYFDTKYFEFANDEAPIDFSVPGGKFDTTVDSDDVKDEDADSVQQTMPGYMTYKPSYSETDGYAAATIFLMGEESFFPDKTSENQDLWYNLCKLPLKPKQTGSTAVYIDYNNGSEYDLELFAKNVEDEKLNFDKEVKNDGIFYITIKEQGRPTMPLATKPSGTYNSEISVGLYHTNPMPCDIYYTTDGITNPCDNSGQNSAVKKYIEGTTLSFDQNTTVKAAAYGNGKWSYVATFTYNFLPHSPYLFNKADEEIPIIYTEEWASGNMGYYVYTCDTKNVAQGISAGNSIYYTFSEDLSVDYVKNNTANYIGNDPETQWVEVDVHSQELAIIDRSRTVRLVTKNQWGISDVSVYHLGIKPAAVTATPGSGLDVEQPIRLLCDTLGAKIYYTTNGDDPRKETRFEYNAAEPIYLKEDTVIKAVALYDGQWSDVSSFWYIFSDRNTSGVSAVYPSGIYIGSVEVILYPDEPGQQIQVSFDGGVSWQDYDGTIIGDTTTVDEHIEFNARIKSDDNPDDYLGDKFVYIIKPLAPVFSPESCEFTKSDVVTVFSPESTNENKDRFELWYTLDGTEPNGSLKAPDNDVIDIPVSGYTRIRAVVVKDGEYVSEMVEHVYNVVYDKPAKPTVTLPSGYYTREIGSSEFTVSFVQPPEDIEIYYTIGDRKTPFDAPDLTVDGGAIKYDENNPIEIKNDTMIKAICVQVVNGNVLKSEVAEFWYEVTPEAPICPPSTIVEELPLIGVDALSVEKTADERCYIEYSIGNDTDGYVPVKFCVDEVSSDAQIRFYIDTKTGNAYADDQKTELLYDAGKNFTDSVVLEIKTILDGAQSQTNAYAYIIGDDGVVLTPPYADKPSGTYTESKTPFAIKFYSIYDNRNDISIEWKYDGEATWRQYPDDMPVFETKDTIIYARMVDGSGNASPCAGYIYTFNPPAPDITPASGIYLKADGKKAVISHAEDIAYEQRNYRTYYKISTDDEWFNQTNPAPIYPHYAIEKTMTVMAYTYNSQTGRVSDTVYRSYVVMDESALGAITIKWPFNQSRISAHKLGKGEYANGIQFIPESDVYYEYSYTLTEKAGGGAPYVSDIIMYDERAAFVPTERIDHMTITAWINGDKNNTIFTHPIDFVHLEIPKTDLPDKAEYDKDTAYHVVNAYQNNPTIIVYYTTNNSDPTIDSTHRKSFTLSRLGAEEKLTSTTTVKTVYFSACGEADCPECKKGNYKKCPDGVYGEIGEYKYPVPTKTTVTVGGGGGGGGGVGGCNKVVDNTRKYTVDIFGDEHPTHIGYINGYPDGSVRPDGNITREEIAAVLYRIKPMAYDEPIETTGDVFPDVSIDRWSVREIEHLCGYGIIEGYPDGTFRPSGNLTRAEFAALIRRFIKSAEIKTASNKVVLSDIDGHWAYDDISFIAKAGLIDGYEDATFRPDREITRAEVMSVINRILGRKPLESYVKSLDFSPFNDLEINKWHYVTVLEATITHDYYLNSQNYEHKWENCK